MRAIDRSEAIESPVFLGFSCHTSIKMELLHAAGYRGIVKIVKNIPVDESEYPYAVEGIHTESVMIDTFQPAGCETYYLSVLKPSVKELVYDLACDKFGLSSADFPHLVHGSCQIASTAKIGNATHFEHGCIVAPYAEIGMGVNVKRGTIIGHHTRIGDFVTINPGVVIAGSCHVGRGVMIGVGATLFDGVSIGANSIIGGGSLVTKSIPEGVVAFGSPCKVIREIQ